MYRCFFLSEQDEQCFQNVVKINNRYTSEKLKVLAESQELARDYIVRRVVARRNSAVREMKAQFYASTAKLVLLLKIALPLFASDLK